MGGLKSTNLSYLWFKIRYVKSGIKNTSKNSLTKMQYKIDQNIRYLKSVVKSRNQYIGLYSLNNSYRDLKILFLKVYSFYIFEPKTQFET